MATNAIDSFDVNIVMSFPLFFVEPNAQIKRRRSAKRTNTGHQNR
jgi:hypothetical protein